MKNHKAVKNHAPRREAQQEIRNAMSEQHEEELEKQRADALVDAEIAAAEEAEFHKRDMEAEYKREVESQYAAQYWEWVEDYEASLYPEVCVG